MPAFSVTIPFFIAGQTGAPRRKATSRAHRTSRWRAPTHSPAPTPTPTPLTNPETILPLQTPRDGAGPIAWQTLLQEEPHTRPPHPPQRRSPVSTWAGSAVDPRARRALRPSTRECGRPPSPPPGCRAGCSNGGHRDAVASFEGGRGPRAAGRGPRAASQGLWPASEIWGGTEAGFTPEPPKGHAALPSGIRVTLRTYGTLSNRVLLSEATKVLDIGDDSQRKRTDVLVPRAGAAVINPRKT